MFAALPPRIASAEAISPRCFIVAAVFLALFLATGTALPRTIESEALLGRVNAILERRALGPDALSVIDNIVRNEAPPPIASPHAVRKLLARPLGAADVAGLFDRAVPRAVLRLANRFPDQRSAGATPAGQAMHVERVLRPYLEEFAEAQRLLREAVQVTEFDATAIVKQLERGPLSANELRRIARAVDSASMQRATAIFLDSVARLVAHLEAGRNNIEFPRSVMQFESAIGVVSIGTAGDDFHPANASVIIDPGGNDRYERTPTIGGAISVIVDLGGNDSYEGSDVAVHGLSALIDLAGDDRYAASGAAWATAIVGASLLIDGAGNDRYASGLTGQGAAAFGLGVLLDLRGDDHYQIMAGGQGFGMAGGVGLLWDRDGNDRYSARGLPDAFRRGGGVSVAQGAAFGSRTAIGGGIGILRDDAGDDRYDAEMFAQGVGFFYGIGLLWDRAGNDRYHAARYAQGNGVHEAIGVLRDEAGDDRYELTVGVGQGMGLDLAVGMLLDGGGDDRYSAPLLAQGTATANGIGVLVDAGGSDEWHMGSATHPSWGQASWSRGLPTLGFLLHEPRHAIFMRGEERFSPREDSAEMGGPLASASITHESSATSSCPQTTEQESARSHRSFSELLADIVPGLGGGEMNAAAFAEVQRRLQTSLVQSIADLPRDNFNLLWALGEALPCALAAAAEDQAGAMWNAMEAILQSEPATPFAGPIAVALGTRPAPAAQMLRLLRALDQHPLCGVRAASLSVRYATAKDEADRAEATRVALSALDGPCWRLQSAALTRLKRYGYLPADEQSLPSFLRTKAPDNESAR